MHKTEGELEASFGLARQLGKHWSLGLEARDHNEIPDYRHWENTAVFAGPVLNYREENWWATLTVCRSFGVRIFKEIPIIIIGWNSRGMNGSTSA